MDKQKVKKSAADPAPVIPTINVPRNFSFPRDDQGFRIFGGVLCPYLDLHAVDINMSAGAVTAITASFSNYDAKLLVANNPAHNHADILAKDAAKAATMTDVETLINTGLRYNPLWTLVDSAAVGFGDTNANPHAPRPVITTVPVGKYDLNAPGRLSAKFHDQGSERIGILPGADSIDVTIEFDLDDGTKATWAENYSKARIILRIPREYCNVRGHAKARWRNRQQEKGPWSNSETVFCLLQDDVSPNAPAD